MLQISHLCVVKINISMKICVWVNESKVRQFKKYIKAEPWAKVNYPGLLGVLRTIKLLTLKHHNNQECTFLASLVF